jgi:hypothetical protein
VLHHKRPRLLDYPNECRPERVSQLGQQRNVLSQKQKTVPKRLPAALLRKHSAAFECGSDGVLAAAVSPAQDRNASWTFLNMMTIGGAVLGLAAIAFVAGVAITRRQIGAPRSRIRAGAMKILSWAASKNRTADPNDSFFIEYVDEFGIVAERRIDIVSVIKKDWAVYIVAFCHLRQEQRIFRGNHIMGMTSVSGKRIDDPQFYFVERLQRHARLT